MVQIWNGLLPNCIFRGWELYCNTEICIAEMKAVGLYCKMGVVGLETILQYSFLYCREEGSVVLQEAWLQGDCIAIQKLYCD